MVGGRGRPLRVVVVVDEGGGAVTVAVARDPALRAEVVIGMVRKRGCWMVGCDDCGCGCGCDCDCDGCDDCDEGGKQKVMILFLYLQCKFCRELIPYSKFRCDLWR